MTTNILKLNRVSQQVSFFSQSSGRLIHSSTARNLLIILCSFQNDFEILGFKFESKHPVPIDSLITNFAETAYVVRHPRTVV